MNEVIYGIKNDADTSMVINYFDFDFIVNIIEDNLIRRVNVYQPTLPNIIAAIESNFKLMFSNEEINMIYPNDMLLKRNDIYRRIIQLLCNRHNLVFVEKEDTDLFSLAYYLYDFLVANFKSYLVGFFSFYLHKERNEIYSAFNLTDQKKNKDSTTLYGKKLYKNQKVAIINANLEHILFNMGSFDITINDILGCTYVDKNIVKFLMDNVKFNDTFYQDIYIGAIYNQHINQSVITDIRFALHQIECSVSDQQQII